jgi:isoleucyl-tRNA synthetase
VNDNTTYKLLEKLGDELRFVFITSYARIHPISKKNDACVEAGAGVFIKVIQSESEKCVIHIYAKVSIMHIFFLRHRP